MKWLVKGVLAAILVTALSAGAPLPAEAATPTNDLFANASPVSLPSVHRQTYDQASTETREPNPSCSEGGIRRTVWFIFEVETTETVSISVDGVSWPLVGLYQGKSLETLSERGCFNYATSNMLSFVAQPTDTYYLQVGDGYSNNELEQQNLRLEVARGLGAGLRQEVDGDTAGVRVDGNSEGRVETRFTTGDWWDPRARVTKESDELHMTVVHGGETLLLIEQDGTQLSASILQTDWEGEVDSEDVSARVQCGYYDDTWSYYDWHGCGEQGSHLYVYAAPRGVDASVAICHWIDWGRWPPYQEKLCVPWWPWWLGY